jgi:hypothetical protein
MIPGRGPVLQPCGALDTVSETDRIDHEVMRSASLSATCGAHSQWRMYIKGVYD